MKSFIKKNIRFIIIVIICITCSVLTTFATTTLFNSNEVYYNNTTSGIQADKVQGAIDELYTCASNYAAYNQRLTAVESQIYPVGSIYISATDSTASAVHDRFGGTWEAYATGRTLIGVGTGTDSNSTSKTFAVNSTGGTYNHTHSLSDSGYAKIALYTAGSIKYKELTTSYWDYTFGVSTSTGGSDSGQTRYGAGLGGSTDSKSSLQPYITVYMWKRTA